MYCGKCGNKLSDGNKFCPKCGKEILKKSNDMNLKKPDKHKKTGIIFFVFIIVLIFVIYLNGNSKRPEGTYVALEYETEWGGGLYLTFESESVVQVEEDYDEYLFNYNIENGNEILIDDGRITLIYNKSNDTIWFEDEELLFTKME